MSYTVDYVRDMGIETCVCICLGYGVGGFCGVWVGFVLGLGFGGIGNSFV